LIDLDLHAKDFEAVAQRQQEYIRAWLTTHVDANGGVSRPTWSEWWLPNEDDFLYTLASLLVESEIELVT